MKTFETSDIYLAAYLRLRGFHLLGERTIGKKMVFTFRRSSEPKGFTIDDYVESYNHDGAMCSPKLLRDSVRDIKSMVKTRPEEAVI